MLLQIYCIYRLLFIAGIRSKLQHFVDSGIGAIWLSPINQSPMIDFGYDISDFRNIDKIFGTLRDFEDLVKRAKELGVKVNSSNKSGRVVLSSDGLDL